MINFFKQFFIYGFASVLGKIAAVFLLPIYTNVLSQNEYGAMALITAAKGIIDLFSNLNIHSGVARDYYEKDIDRIKLISTGFYSILFFSIIVFVILYTTQQFWIVNVLNVAGYEKSFIVMLLTIPAGSLFSYFAILTRYKQKAVLYSVGTVFQLLIQISLTIYFVVVLRAGIVGVFYGILGGEIVGILFFFFLNKEFIKISFDKNLLQRILVFSLPTLPAILAGWLDSSLGQILIGKYISVKDVGIYSIALQISSVFLLINTAFGNVWYPYIYENIKNNDFLDNIMRLFKLIVFILSVLAINLSLLSDEIILLLSNKNYIAAGEYLIILTIPMSMTILYWFSVMGASISRKTKYISYAAITGSVVNLGLLIVLLPIYGVIMVPISFGISRIIAYTISSYFTKKELSISFPINPILFFILGVLICYFLKHLISNQVIIWFILLIFDIVIVTYFYRTHGIGNLMQRLIYVKK